MKGLTYGYYYICIEREKIGNCPSRNLPAQIPIGISRHLATSY